jgi:membrane-bound lytic murein transglycosylase F
MHSRFVAFLAVFVLAAGCQRDPGPGEQFVPSGTKVVEPERVPPVDRDLAAIRASGKIVLLAPTNSTTYFVYRGEPLGFEFELVRAFAKQLELPLEVRVVADHKALFEMLNRGEGDIAAARLVPSPENEELAAFTKPLYQTEPALVQQQVPPSESGMPEPAKTEVETPPTPAEQEITARLVERPEQLAGEKVTLPERSPYKRTLIELSDEISGEVYVVEVGGNVDDEALITKVAKGDVAFTVAQSNLAELKESVYSNVKVRPIVGPMHRVSWAIRRNAPDLREALDRWIEDKRNAGLVGQIYKKYFTDRKGYKERVESEYLTSVTGRLSQFDPLFRRYSADLGWDWRLLASQAYQESRFKPDARSWAGAEGLLQLMPATGREFGVRNPRDPEDNVRAAVKFLQWLTRYWESRVPDDGERLKFILASYNTGAGHVEDAQRLTAKYGRSQ